ncbi:hypothetical protein [Parvularcula lutaonensis]|uniref:Uncharacterized protein n=1 Tax=Parvularcula lutaonensis TaxID=491923 RepID=A0ABV7MBR4_9PROT|nr:hypothetical protein [Parvularcula lutaonensis]GGY47275.1 hypothetical protein GCM10007148_15720 [Parvularcula lutaonensis]
MSDFSLFSGGIAGTAALAAGIVMALYMARAPIQNVILEACQAIAGGLRFASRTLVSVRTRLVQRNREVLLSAGREAAARMVEREYERFADKVHRDLGDYPTLHQELAGHATRLDEDYAKSASNPPAPPGWADAVEAVAAVPDKAEPVLRQVLESIHGSFKKAGEEANKAYREDCRMRHKHLHDMAPSWRESVRLLGQVKTRVETLNERAAVVDESMRKFEEIHEDTDQAAMALQSSALVQFFIAGLVLLVATGGAVVNFHLIARPMSEMVGGNTYIGSFKTADIAALVIILVELSMGLFLMECLRITSLFPVIASLADKVRTRLAIVSFTLLLSLASVEAGLAYMRELLLQDELATAAVLRGEVAQEASFLWITTAAQMGMGFILPFALTFIAIPLETFIHSMRAVLGWGASGVLMTMAFTLRILARTFDEGGKVFAQLYDVAIFAPLWAEKRFLDVRKEMKASPGAREMLEETEARLSGQKAA